MEAPPQHPARIRGRGRIFLVFAHVGARAVGRESVRGVEAGAEGNVTFCLKRPCELAIV